ncbi:hypothetical protein UPYG_G00028720 [Umbra pygmaea]|uniref:Late embryogenesis abundant protein LEA-2 subgroup domain-containing protein n=1 Tax=Umbra pygmaea TaxID=75934 RepID=A0ABD0Y9D4_UMBPY
MDGESQVEKEVYVNFEARRRRSSWRLAVVLFLQNALLVVCLSVSFYCLLRQPEPVRQEEDIYIRFEPINDIQGNVSFGQFDHNKINLSSNNIDIQISCNGTYMLYMEVYSEGLEMEPGFGNFSLMVGKRELARIAVEAKEMGCKDSIHHQIVDLRNGDNARLNFMSTNFKVCKLTLGLHYLHGRQCQR